MTRPRMGLWTAHLGVGVALIAVYLLVPREPFSTGIYQALGWSAAILIVIGVRRYRPAAARGWYLVALSQALFVLGDLTYTAYSWVGVAIPFPSLADALYVAGYPFMALGIARVVVRPGGRKDLSRLIDASILTVGVGMLAWVELIHPYVDDRSLSGLALAVSISYPLSDLLILAVAARILIGPRSIGLARVFLGGALVTLLTSDIVYVDQSLAGTYVGGIVDIGWLLSYTLLGASALHPSMRELGEREDRPFSVRARLAVLGGSCLLAPVAMVLALRHGGGDPHDFIVLVSGSALLFLLALTRMGLLLREVHVRAEALARQGSELETAFDELRRSEDERRRLLARTLRAGEEERVRLAADLHDGPIQRLAAVGYRLGTVRQQLGRGAVDEAIPGLVMSEAHLGEEVDGLRKVMSSLRPPALDQQGLEGALRDHLASFSSTTGAGWELEASLPERLPPDVETTVYRLAQEALANVAKHARATRVKVEVVRENGRVELRVQDDGVGFSPGAVDPGDGLRFGLIAMREQARIIGGDVEIESAPGRGTVVRASMPSTEPT
jgi:signal transduction histidine kinase